MIYPQWPYVTTPRSDSGCTKYCLVVAEVASEKKGSEVSYSRSIYPKGLKTFLEKWRINLMRNRLLIVFSNVPYKENHCKLWQQAFLPPEPNSVQFTVSGESLSPPKSDGSGYQTGNDKSNKSLNTASKVI